MMATPADLERFALGFALSEGIIDRPADCYGIKVTQHDSGVEIDLDIASACFAQLKMRRRRMSGRSGCGICGIESLSMLSLDPPRVSAPDWLKDFSAGVLQRAHDRLPAWQPFNAAVGSLHAAAWCAPDGEIVFAKEDIGRHNALDKLIGELASSGTPVDAGFVMMSSRLSFELAMKCAHAGIAALAGISAPTGLAVDIAMRAGITLYGYCRHDSSTQFTTAPPRDKPFPAQVRASATAALMAAI
jgi:formate dehydrogenase family accessory protein FdhD